MSIKKTIKSLVYKLLPCELKRKIDRLDELDKLDKLDADIKTLISEARQTRIKTEIILTYLTGFSARNNERIVINDYQYANPDLLNSYKVFAKCISKGDKVLDCASGVGYGTAYLNDHTEASSIIGGDINPQVVEFSQKIFGEPFSVLKEKVTSFQQLNITNTDAFPENHFDKICSFETIEHVPDHVVEKAFENIYYWLKPKGICYCSVPNNDIFPFPETSSGYHFRHYTPQEFYDALNKVGFSSIKIYHTNPSGELLEEWTKGCYGILLAVCEK